MTTIDELQDRIQALETNRQETDLLYKNSGRLNIARNKSDLLQIFVNPGLDTNPTWAGLYHIIDLNETSRPVWGEVAAIWSKDNFSPLPDGMRVYLSHFPFTASWINNPNQALFVADVYADDRVNKTIQDALTQNKSRALAVIPLKHAGRWVGFVSLSWDAPHKFSTLETAIYQAFTSLASSVVENQQLQVQQKDELVNTLYHIGSRLNTVSTDNALLKIVTRPTSEAPPAFSMLADIEVDEKNQPHRTEIISTWQEEDFKTGTAGVNANKAIWNLIASKHKKKKSLSPITKNCYTLAEFPFTSLWLTSQTEPQLIANITTDHRLNSATRKILTQAGVQAMAIVPLVLKESWVGVLSLFWNTSHAFNESDFAIYQAYINLVSPVVAKRRQIKILTTLVEQKTFEADQFKLLVTNLAEAIAIGEMSSGKLIFVNNAFQQLLGYSSLEKLLNKQVSTVVPKLAISSKNAKNSKTKPLKTLQSSLSKETKLTRQDGTTFNAYLTTFTLPAINNQPKTLAIYVQELSQPHQQELTKLQETRNQVEAKLKETIAQAKAELQETRTLTHAELETARIKTKKAIEATQSRLKKKLETTRSQTLAEQQALQATANTYQHYSESCYFNLFNSVSDWAWSINLNGEITAANAATQQILGHSANQLVGRPILEFVHPLDQLLAQELFQQAISRQNGWEETISWLGPDSEEVICNSNLQPIYDPAEQLVGFTGINTNISERKKVDTWGNLQRNLVQTLASAPTLGDALVQSVKTAIKATPLNRGRLYFVDKNANVLKLVAQQNLPDELAGKIKTFDIDTPIAQTLTTRTPIYADHLEISAAPQLAAGDPEAKSVAIVPILHKGQFLATLHLASTSLKSTPAFTAIPLETIVSYIANFVAFTQLETKLRNVQTQAENNFETVNIQTETTRLEAELAQAEANLHTAKNEFEAILRHNEKKQQKLFNTVSDWVWTIDTEGNFTSSNPMVQHMLNFQPDELVGAPMFNFIHPGSRPRVQSVLMQTILEQTVEKPAGQVELTIPWVHRDGSVKHSQSTLHPVFDRQGYLFGFQGIDQNSAPLKQTEAERDLLVHHLKVSAEISEQTNTIQDPAEFLRAVAILLQAHLNLYHVKIYTFDRISRELVLQSCAGAAAKQLQSKGDNVALGHKHSLIARAVRSWDIVLVNNVKNEPAFTANPLLPNTQSQAIVPFFTSDHPLGVLDLHHDKPNRFSQFDVEWFGTISSYMATVMTNLTLLRQQIHTKKERATQQKKIADLQQKTSELQQAVDKAQEEIIQTLPTPVIPMMGQMIAIPLIGKLDPVRVKNIIQTLLDGINKHRAKMVILDASGIPNIDYEVKGYLDSIIQTADAQGVQTMVTGISDDLPDSFAD